VRAESDHGLSREFDRVVVVDWLPSSNETDLLPSLDLDMMISVADSPPSLLARMLIETGLSADWEFPRWRTFSVSIDRILKVIACPTCLLTPTKRPFSSGDSEGKSELSN
jgi:hypothetical protein